MPVDSHEARQRAEAKMKKAQAAARERDSARAAYEAAAVATRRNIARQKALRLAKEAEETPPEAAEAAKAVKRPAAPRKRRTS
jgi:hypothetical protein